MCVVSKDLNLVEGALGTSGSVLELRVLLEVEGQSFEGSPP